MRLPAIGLRSHGQKWVKLLVLVALLGGSPGLLAQTQGTEGSAKAGLALTLTDLPPDQLKAMLEQQSLRGAGLPAGAQALSALDPVMMNRLRASLHQVDQATNCSADRPAMGEALEQARAKAKAGQKREAADLLSKTWDTFMCERTVVTSETLGEFLLLLAKLRFQETRKDGGLFTEALYVGPGLSVPADAGPPLQKAFRQAQLGLPYLAKVEVDVQLEGLEKVSLMVDGRALPVGKSSVPIGRHFLQLVTSEGELLGSAVDLPLKLAEQTSVPWPPPSLKPMSGSNILSSLERAVLTERPDGYLADGLERMLARHNLSSLLLISQVDLPTGKAPKGLWIKPGNQYTVVLPEKREAPAPTPDVKKPPSRAKGVAITLGCAAVSVAGAGYWGYLYQLKAQGGHDALPENHKVTSVVSSALGWAAAAGALVSASVTWQIPGPLYHKQTSVSLEPVIAPQGGEPGMAVSWGLRW